MPLNNDGDDVTLFDADSVARSRLTYGEQDARSGQWIEGSR